MRNSAVWACLRLRANLVSTMPIDVFRRRRDGIQVEAPKPPVLVNPDGTEAGIAEWMYSTQVDLDRTGNVFGLITERNALGLPARIELVDQCYVSVICDGPRIKEFRLYGERYDPADVWHERQWTVPGIPLGLSPVAYAAWSIQEGLSAQKFAIDWFGGSAIPMAELKNTAKTITPKDAEVARNFYRAAVSNGDLFVHGNDWEYKPIQAVAQQTEFLESRAFTATEIARFFDCPADLIDAAMSGQSVTYANITQRNLQFLIMHLGPAVTRREHALSRLVPGGQYVKLNRGSLLAMDPETQAKVIQIRTEARNIAPSEARAMFDLPPFTPDQIAEFDQLFVKPAATDGDGSK